MFIIIVLIHADFVHTTDNAVSIWAIPQLHLPKGAGTAIISQ